MLQLETSVGGSAQTFNGFVAYLRAHASSIVIFENVDSLDDTADQDPSKNQVSNLGVVKAALRVVGFDTQVILADAHL